MTKFEQALQNYTRRAQFHDAVLLDAVIQAAREEEREKFPELTAAAKRVVEEDRQWLAERFRGL